MRAEWKGRSVLKRRFFGLVPSPTGTQVDFLLLLAGHEFLSASQMLLLFNWNKSGQCANKLTFWKGFKDWFTEQKSQSRSPELSQCTWCTDNDSAQKLDRSSPLLIQLSDFKLPSLQRSYLIKGPSFLKNKCKSNQFGVFLPFLVGVSFSWMEFWTRYSSAI